MADDDAKGDGANWNDAWDRMVKRRNDSLNALRDRAGLSMQELARLMGFKGQSSIQRYLSSTYDKEYRPEIARRFRTALLNKGDPPITDEDLKLLVNWRSLKTNDPGYPDFSEFEKVRGKIENLKPGLEGSDTFKVSLPIEEGQITVELPNYISAESAEAASKWLQHLLGFATEVGEAVQKWRPPKKT